MQIIFEWFIIHLILGGKINNIELAIENWPENFWNSGIIGMWQMTRMYISTSLLLNIPKT